MNRTLGLGAAAAAIVIIAILGVGFLSSNGLNFGGPDESSPSPTEAPSPLALPPSRETLQAGTYAADNSLPFRVTFEVSDGWFSCSPGADEVGACKVLAGDPSSLSKAFKVTEQGDSASWSMELKPLDPVIARVERLLSLAWESGATPVVLPTDETVEIMPDSLYGVSKAYGEAMARYYVDHHGLSAICLRIGSWTGTEVPHAPENLWDPSRDADPETLARRARFRATWLSDRDGIHLVECALDTPKRWFLCYGISDNPRKLWDIEHAREGIGYRPQDSTPVEIAPGRA